MPTRSEVAPLLVALGATDADADADWRAILDHKWYLSERLGRDVGLRVALVDYFENIRPSPVPRRGASARRARSLAASLAEPVLGLEQVLTEFVDAVRGPRSLAL
jgi:hypothetical protein